MLLWDRAVIAHELSGRAGAAAYSEAIRRASAQMEQAESRSGSSRSGGSSRGGRGGKKGGSSAPRARSSSSSSSRVRHSLCAFVAKAGAVKCCACSQACFHNAWKPHAASLHMYWMASCIDGNNATRTGLWARACHAAASSHCKQTASGEPA